MSMSTYAVTILQTNGLLRTVEVRAEGVAQACALAMARWNARNVFGVFAR